MNNPEMDRDSEEPSEYEQSQQNITRGAPQIGQDYDDVSSEEDAYDPHLESKINRIKNGLHEKRLEDESKYQHPSGNNTTAADNHTGVIESSVSRLDAVLKRQRERFDQMTTNLQDRSSNLNEAG